MQQRNVGFEHSLHEVAAEIGVAAETVRNIERRALNKLRKILKRRGYTASDFFDALVRRSDKS